ncbi:MAG: hypothetical protein CME63_16440 [Halobacteriovoraceae bacterium]|nr:hypothetical protein [Halobacteriovoraceae bacterium]|tara:strand:- start:23361 stop:24083 length:723 start_codon:yes stop_codon:yes gene_type:complete
MDYPFNSMFTLRKLVKNQANKNGKSCRCFYCDHEFSLNFEGSNFMSIDHKIPRKVFLDIDPSLENRIDNLVLCCKSCNSAKGKSSLFELIDNEIREKSKDLNEFKKTREMHREFYNQFALKTIFCSLEADEQWVNNPGLHLQEIISQLEKSSTISNIRKMKDGIRFNYDKKYIFNYWDCYCAFYVNSIDHFNANKKVLLSNGYSLIQRKFLRLSNPNEMVEQILTEAKFCSNIFDSNNIK